MLGRRLSSWALALVLACCALLPVSAQGAKAPPEGLAMFKLPASNGYELLVIAS